jgi:hypothetical protein
VNFLKGFTFAAAKIHFMFPRKSFLFFCLFLCFFQAFAQPVNDDPCGAISIPVSNPLFTGNNCSASTTYSWTNATLTAATPNPSCAASGFSNIRDVWYKLTVPASGKIQMTINAPLGLFLTFYNASSCSATLTFSEIKCLPYTTTTQDSVFTLSSLSAGASIFLRVARTFEMPNPTGSVQICAAESITTPTIDNTKRIGIGTNQPLAKPDVVGTTIIRDSLQVGKSIETQTQLITKDIQIKNNAGANKILVSDASGNGQWTFRDTTFSSAWISSPFNSRDTTVDGTCVRVRHLVAPEITADVIARKHVTVYFRVGSIGPYQLPYINEAGGATNQINWFMQNGKIFVYRHTLNSCRFTSSNAESYPGEPVMINLPQSLQYRYVIN